MKEVKQEVLEKIEKLEMELAGLQEFKQEREKIKREHQEALRSLAREQEANFRKMKYAKLQELFSAVPDKCWRMSVIDVYSTPKCEKCDEFRKVSFKSPLGRTLVEDCSCSTKKSHVYYPYLYQLSCVRREDSGNERGLLSWFKRYSDSDSYTVCFRDMKIWDKSVGFVGLGKNEDYFFLVKEDCQSCCDNLNKDLTPFALSEFKRIVESKETEESLF
jgi:hypothetical protein